MALGHRLIIPGLADSSCRLLQRSHIWISTVPCRSIHGQPPCFYCFTPDSDRPYKDKSGSWLKGRVKVAVISQSKTRAFAPSPRLYCNETSVALNCKWKVSHEVTTPKSKLYLQSKDKACSLFWNVALTTLTNYFVVWVQVNIWTLGL